MGILRSDADRPRRPAIPRPVARIAGGASVVWGVTLLTFAMLDALPGNTASVLLGAGATHAQIDALTVKLRLQGGFVERYVSWLHQVLAGNLGRSTSSGQAVVSVLAQRLPVSVELVVLALVLAVGVAVPTALLAARWPGGVIDRAVMAISTVSVSIAPFVLSMGLVLLFAMTLSWLPAVGFIAVGDSVSGNLRTLVLPAVSLALPLAGGYVRVLRGDLVEQLRADHVVTALALGMAPWQILTRHALRNSLPGLAALVGLNVGTLIGSAVLVEQVFALPGLGTELVRSVTDRDIPVTEGIVLVFALAVVASTLATDAVHRALDPRIRLAPLHS